MQGTRAGAVLRQHWVVVALGLFLGLLTGVVALTTQSQQYTATATVYVSLDRGDSPNDLNAGSAFAQSLMPSFAGVVTMPVILEPVAARLSPRLDQQQIARMISASVPAGTTLLDVEATSTDPRTSAEVANAVAEQLQSAAATLSPRTETGAAPVRIVPISGALPPTRSDALSGPLLLGLAVVAAAALIGGLLWIWEVTTAPLRSRRDLAAATPVPVVGTIPYSRHRPEPSAPADPESAHAQQVVALAANLLNHPAVYGSRRGILVTSPRAGDGSTSVAVDLATVLSASGRRVLLVDAAGGTSRTASAQLAAPWAADTGSEQAPRPCRHAELPNLSVLSVSGSRDRASVPVATLTEKITTQLGRFDLVVVDTPPVLESSVAAVLSRQIGGALLVVRGGRSRAAAVTDSLDRLRLAGAQPLGVVINHDRLVRSGPGPLERLRGGARAAAHRPASLLPSAPDTAPSSRTSDPGPPPDAESGEDGGAERPEPQATPRHDPQSTTRHDLQSTTRLEPRRPDRALRPARPSSPSVVGSPGGYQNVRK